MGDTKQDLANEELKTLLEHVLKNAYKAKDYDTKSEGILNHCLKIFGKDYKYSVVSNTNGEICSHYPTKIVLLEYLLTDTTKSNERVQSFYDTEKLRELFNKAKFARCRGRFVAPVILYEGKHICRSATISGGVEIYGRSVMGSFFAGGENISDSEGNAESANEWQLFDRIRGHDIKLLKEFNVSHICDLMVEKKKVKFGMNITSSEKVDKENRYSDFTILCVPYPGCEFFKDWRDNGYMAEGMMFDWQQGHVDAKLDLPGNITPPRGIDWTQYKSWDLVKLSQNYLLLLLHYIKEGDSGMLIHCISGWDRTPLFTSIIRLSLWADGVVHPSLTPADILYLTVAYDWYLFGHNFPDRIGKGEDIFFFCFNFLKYITGEEYSVHRRGRRRGSRTVSRTDSEYNIDGVLLDPELQRASYRGSNTSINSTSSLNSTKSSVDNAPIYFTAGSPEEEGFIPNGNPMMGNNPPRMSPQTKSATDPQFVHQRQAMGQYSSTSPVAVPYNIHRCHDAYARANSPGFGSWQIISGTGSLRGSTSSHESPHSSTSEQSSHNHTSRTEMSDFPEETVRKQRLDAVRRLFLTIYTSVIDFKNIPDGGVLSGLLDHFAEKVGFRSARSTPV